MLKNRKNCVYIKNCISNDIYLLLYIYNSNLQSVLDAPIKLFYFLSLKEKEFLFLFLFIDSGTNTQSKCQMLTCHILNDKLPN